MSDTQASTGPVCGQNNLETTDKRSEDEMQIHGLNKTTLLDFPEHVAATVFTGGCNFCCPFCHNKDLVMNPMSQPLIPEADVLQFLQKRRGVLQGVCITGGEPTLQKDLPYFIRQIKKMGYLVKLDTNGYRPEVLNHLLQEKLLDYVAMDIKSSRERYFASAGIGKPDISRIEESVRILADSGISYEYRTTVVRELHTAEDFEAIGKWLAGSPAYFLQGYRDHENVIQPGLSAYGKEEMESFAGILRKNIKKVEIRG